MVKEDLFSVLEDRIDTLLNQIKDKEEKVSCLEAGIKKSAGEITALQKEILDSRNSKNTNNTLKKFLAFSIKDNYILNIRNEQTKKRIRTLINKLDLAFDKDQQT